MAGCEILQWIQSVLEKHNIYVQASNSLDRDEFAQYSYKVISEKLDQLMVVEEINENTEDGPEINTDIEIFSRKLSGKPQN